MTLSIFLNSMAFPGMENAFTNAMNFHDFSWPSESRLFLFSSGAHVAAVTSSLFLSVRRMWPINFHLRLFTSLLNGSISALTNNSSVLAWPRHRTSNIFHRHLFWKTSISLSLLLFIFQVSQPYNNTGTINDLSSFSFVFLVILWELQIVFSLTKEPLAFESLFLRSFILSPSLRTLAPRYVNSSTSSILSSPFIMILSWSFSLPVSFSY